MAGAERGSPGVIEQGNYLLRNVDVAVAGVALFMGHMGVAALAAISAGLNHAIAEHMKKRRLKGA